MASPPPISPDGAFWWDGQSWQPIPHEGPIPPPGVPVVEPAPPPWAPARTAAVAKTKPPKPALSWLPDDMEDVVPAIVPMQRPPKIYDTAPPVGTVPPPVWIPGKRSAAIRRVAAIAGIAAVVVLAIGSGAWAVQHYGLPSLSSLTASHSSPAATPSIAVTPSPTIVQPFTAKISGAACNALHVGDPACWKVTFTNTGPALGNLAMVFVTDPPYSNWFQHHFGAEMAVKDNAAGCSVDNAHLQVDCGAVPAGASITIDLVGYMANVGVHTYAVRFFDISAGQLLDVDMGADGTPFMLTWQETVA
jgi:hypothetical protein